MQTERIPVADGVELTVDVFDPVGPAAAAETAPTAAAGTADTAADAGPPGFVLVHGLASNARLWDGVAGRLVERGHRAATVDMRGHGRSSSPDGPYDVATVADDLAAVLAALARQGFDRPVVAGQSWGGNVVVELAARHPDATRGIVCVDGGWLEVAQEFGSWEAARERLAPPRLLGRQLREVEGYIRAAHPDWPETGIAGMLANFEVRGDGTIAPHLTFEHHLLVLRGLWEHSPATRYAGLQVPVLLVPAESAEDPAWTLRKRRGVGLALAAIPRARVHWFEGDHDIHAQHPAELADVMCAQLDDGFFR